MPDQPAVSRRRLFGYAGAAGVGTAAGVVGGKAWADQSGPHNLPVGEGVRGQTYSPHGAHQPGIVTPTPAAQQLVAFDLLPDFDAAALGRLMRVWSATVVALTEGRPAPGDAAPDMARGAVSFTATLGFGPGVFDLPGLESRRPAGFVEIPPMDHDRLQERWVGGDLLVMLQADDDTTLGYATRRLTVDARPFARPRWTQAGSWRGVDAEGRAVTGRNHFGQVDGSRNPAGEALDEVVWSDDGWLAGGTQLVIRRIEMDLDDWDTATRDRQERSLGRDLAAGAPLTGGEEHDDVDLAATADGAPAIALDAHARRAHPSENRGRQMLRRSVNYVHTDDVGTTTHGLLFLAFQASIAEQFVPVQQRLDQLDALNEWTHAIGSAVFVIPPGFEAGGWIGQTLLD